MNPESLAERKTDVHTKPHLTVNVEPDLEAKINECIKNTQDFLLKKQNPEGFWIGELFVDTTVICDYLLYMYWRNEVDFARQDKIIKNILRRQQPDGGWNIYTGGPSELNATVKAYFVLKLVGFTPDEPEMKKARDVILRLGGIPKCNTYNKLYLALMGQFPWKYLPSIPIEVILLPTWFPFNLYEMSSWTRAMYVPLAIIHHFRPIRHLPPEKQLHELYPYGTEGMDFSLPYDKKLLTLRNFFLLVDRILKIIENSSFKPFRKIALKKGEEWIRERITHGSDGLGAIFPSMLNTLFALKSLGYSDDHPTLAKAEADFKKLEVDDIEQDDFRVQPCESPVWDTAIGMYALAASGIPADHPQLTKGADWLLSKEVKIRGDWSIKNPYPIASGFAFEFNNEYYPDADDTFKVLLALRKVKATDEEKKKEIMQRSLEWARSFQCQDGGFAAFDKDVTKPWLEKVPFADHNAMLDPSCSDITGRGLDYLGQAGFTQKDPRIQRMINFIKKTQEEDGSWFGRWGVNYIYGTWQALRGLHSIGIEMQQDWIIRSRDWIESCQNPDGGWGETPASYDDPRKKGQGPSTPSQTAWAIMALITFGDPTRTSIQRGIRYLTTTQQIDGTWKEDQITGTGFPCVFYLKYDMYRTSWPLIALAEYRDLCKRKPAFPIAA